MPQMDAPVIDEDESLDDREEGNNEAMKIKFDYMSEWVYVLMMLNKRFLN